jgi:7-carboxy-7-deazaguanine synthase
MANLRITEIFHSLQGESTLVGAPTVFVRLTGCPLRCGYCDTAYAFSGGSLLGIDDVLSEVKQYQTRHVTVTGGEPLSQPECLTLLTKLCDQSYVVSLETSGALPVQSVDPRVIKIMDIKTPGSGEHERNHLDNLKYIGEHDQIKFVLCDQADYQWAKAFVDERDLTEKCIVLFSPSHGQLDYQTLAEWILADKLAVRFQCQLHKIIWGEKQGH